MLSNAAVSQDLVAIQRSQGGTIHHAVFDGVQHQPNLRKGNAKWGWFGSTPPSQHLCVLWGECSLFCLCCPLNTVSQLTSERGSNPPEDFTNNWLKCMWEVLHFHLACIAVKWWQSFLADAEAFWAFLKQQLRRSTPQKQLNTQQPTFAFHLSSLQSACSVSAFCDAQILDGGCRKQQTFALWLPFANYSKFMVQRCFLGYRNWGTGIPKKKITPAAFCIHLAFGTSKFIQIKKGKLKKHSDFRSLPFFWDKKPTWRASVWAAI